MSIEEIRFPVKVNVYQCENNGKKFFFDGDTGFFSEIDSLTSEILNLISENTEEEIVQKLRDRYLESEISAHINNLKEVMEKGLFGDRRGRHDNLVLTKEKWDNGEILQNLWLNISHNCNMRCVYCFAHGGNYGRRNMIMSKDVAKKCIDYWYKHLNKSIDKATIVFFGGEPLVNKEVFYFAVNYINGLLEKDNIKPQYNFTSNGTLFDDEFIEFMMKNNIGVTLSIDGGKDIQDKNRPLVTNESSYDLIKNNVAKLKKNIDILTARMTLTRENVKNFKNAVEDLWNMGFSQVQYDVVSSQDPSLMLTEEDYKVLFPQIKELTEITYQNILKKKWVVLRNVTKVVGSIHESDLDIMGCSLYAPFTLMFTPEGNMYKCQRLMDDEKYCIGNVDNGLDWEKFIKTNGRPVIGKCQSCWARNICNDGCAQVNLVNSGDLTKPYDLWCEHTKFTIEQAFKIYTNIYTEFKDNFYDFFK